MKNIAVFCGSSSGNLSDFLAAKWLAQHSFTLIYGGSKVGLMGEIADTVLKERGKVIGVMPKVLQNKEIAHPNLTELIHVNSMDERKRKMMELADGFIALPGGPGTMEEIFEVITWSQIGIHRKPYAFYNVAGYYDFLHQFLEHMEKSGFISSNNREKIVVAGSLHKIEQHFQNYQPPKIKTYS